MGKGGCDRTVVAMRLCDSDSENRRSDRDRGSEMRCMRLHFSLSLAALAQQAFCARVTRNHQHDPLAPVAREEARVRDYEAKDIRLRDFAGE